MSVRRWSSLWMSPFVVCALVEQSAFGWNLAPAITGGLMQQPTSNYYLACYGMNIDLENQNGAFIARAAYAERPEFNRNGFAEKDRTGLLLAGTTAAKIYGGSVRVFFGGGTASGYVSKIASDNKTTLDRRSYQLPGPSAAVEFAVNIGKIHFSLNHTTFIGYGGKIQTEAMVAWPYNFYFISAGYSI
jgi:hypothetical protein